MGRPVVATVLTAIVFSVVLGAVAGLAQPRSVPPQEEPRFDVVSIRPSGPESARGRRFGGGPGRLVVRHVTLKDLIAHFYRLKPGRLLGGPDWAETDRFDVVATYRGSEVRPEMLHALLADRFKLRLRGDTRDLPHYALVTASGDGDPGAAVRPAAIADCDAWYEQRDREGSPGMPTGPHCGLIHRPQGPLWTIVYGATTMDHYAAGLYADVGRVVLDETGLAGRFDFEITYESERNRSLMRLLDPEEERTWGRGQGPSVFVALEEQLGLKLLPRNGPVEVLVIEHAERPAPN